MHDSMPTFGVGHHGSWDEIDRFPSKRRRDRQFNRMPGFKIDRDGEATTHTGEINESECSKKKKKRKEESEQLESCRLRFSRRRNRRG